MRCSGGDSGLFTFGGVTWWSSVGPLAMTLVFLNISNNVIERGLRSDDRTMPHT
jgi:hypothetical protein